MMLTCRGRLQKGTEVWPRDISGSTVRITGSEDGKAGPPCWRVSNPQAGKSIGFGVSITVCMLYLPRSSPSKKNMAERMSYNGRCKQPIN